MVRVVCRVRVHSRTTNASATPVGLKARTDRCATWTSTSVTLNRDRRAQLTHPSSASTLRDHSRAAHVHKVGSSDRLTPCYKAQVHLSPSSPVLCHLFPAVLETRHPHSFIHIPFHVFPERPFSLRPRGFHCSTCLAMSSSSSSSSSTNVVATQVSNKTSGLQDRPHPVTLCSNGICLGLLKRHLKTLFE